jgi:pimeloyl-ACP methyl ester carboxylesterase
MRLLVNGAVVLCALLVAAMPAWAQNNGGLPSKEHLQAGEAYKQAERVVLLEDAAQGDVVHYAFDVPVGPGPFDTIRMHRVVKEVNPGRPAKKMEGILLLPGLPQLFEPIFMMAAAPGVPPDQGSVAVYLASHGVDVWGMDYGHSFIPYPTASLAFLKGWGIDKEAAHVHTALSIARWLRVTSEQGNGPIHLLGFSYGGLVVYAAASEDTQHPGNLRNIKGIVPVDGTPVRQVMGSAAQLNSCNTARDTLKTLDSGTYHFNSSASHLRAEAARDYPDTPNLSSGAATAEFPGFPSGTFTNYQFMLVNGIRNKTYAGSYTVTPPSAMLMFTYGHRSVTLGTTTPSYYPLQIVFDGAASRCGTDTYPAAFDDHLGEIEVPIFYVARQDTDLYTTTQTRSRDVTTLIINPALSPNLYGHADSFLANDAASKIWRPILDWIQAHR